MVEMTTTMIMTQPLKGRLRWGPFFHLDFKTLVTLFLFHLYQKQKQRNPWLSSIYKRQFAFFFPERFLFKRRTNGSAQNKNNPPILIAGN
jgi:hypothetical protein